jgi:hypothetical protein
MDGDTAFSECRERADVADPSDAAALEHEIGNGRYSRGGHGGQSAIAARPGLVGLAG